MPDTAGQYRRDTKHILTAFHLPQGRDRLRHELVGPVGVARPLDAHEAAVPDIALGAQDGRQVHVALADGAVLVPAAGHVLDGDGAEVRGELPYGLVGFPAPADDAVPGVQGERQPRHGRGEAAPVVAVVD